MKIDEEYFNSEEFQEILENYEASINVGSNPFMDADDLVDLADYYSWQADDDKAEQAIDYALELYPGSTLPNVFKARKALAEEDYAQAEFYAGEIENHDDPDYHYLLAEIMIAEGDVLAAASGGQQHGGHQHGGHQHGHGHRLEDILCFHRSSSVFGLILGSLQGYQISSSVHVPFIVAFTCSLPASSCGCCFNWTTCIVGLSYSFFFMFV